MRRLFNVVVYVTEAYSRWIIFHVDSLHLTSLSWIIVGYSCTEVVGTFVVV